MSAPSAEPPPARRPPPSASAAAPRPERLLLPTASIVEQSVAQARRALALVLAGAALIVGGVLAERIWVSAALRAAAERHAQAHRIAGEMRLADQRLTSSALLAVTTGQQRWIDDYDAQLRAFQAALESARALSPAAQGLDDGIRKASVELDDLREAAFEAVIVGEVEAAQRIFEGEPYRLRTERLARATHDFTQVTVEGTQAELAALKRRSWVAGAAALLAAGLLGAGLWRRLSQRLSRSRDVLLEAEERVQRLASIDLLTDLPNRAALHDAMALAMGRARRAGRSMALLMIDLHRFKAVNDRHGHTVGDRVLQEVARRLRECLRGGELRARFGGDEFVVAIDEGRDPGAARIVAERIVQRLGQPFAVDELLLSIGASVGIARFPDDAGSDDELLRKADSALYRAKARGRGAICFYDGSLDELVAGRAALELEIREGIAGGQFVPHYQPIVDLATRRVQSLELLCRWQHPQRGLLAPVHFIAVAEACGLIGPMTLSLLNQACLDLRRLPAEWRLSVNVAPQQIQDPDLVLQLQAVLHEHGVPPSRLDIELTETALVSDAARAREVMGALKAAGITVTLDDFGTGYSSLSYLAEMSFDKIKIDRSFVRTLHERAQSVKIVDAVIGLSRNLGVQTVAEGVETERDAAALLKLGCGLAQGYLFGRPVPADELVRADEPETA